MNIIWQDYSEILVPLHILPCYATPEIDADKSIQICLGESHMSYDQIVFKTLSDPEFRKQLKEDPEAALKSAGITATPELVEALKKFDWNQVHEVQRCGTLLPT